MGIDSFEKIKNIIKDIFDMTTKNRIHNSSRVHLFGVGVCIDIVCIAILSMLVKFELIPLTCGAIIFAMVKCVYIYLVVHINRGSYCLMNLYNMVTTDNRMDHKTVRRQFLDNLNENVDFEKNFNIVHPILWHRLYYEIIFSNNTHGSPFANHYKWRICKKGKNPIVIGGYINTIEKQSLLYEYSIKLSFLSVNINECKSVIDIRIKSAEPTSDLMSLVEFIRIYSFLIKEVVSIRENGSYSTIIDLFEKIKEYQSTKIFENFDSNIYFPICEYVSRILIDIEKNNNTLLKSTDYISLCKLISNYNPQQNIYIEEVNKIWMSNNLNDIMNRNCSYTKKQRAIAKMFKRSKPSEKPPPKNRIALLINFFKKG